MENGIYAAITRQDGLLKELQIIANNIANSSTTGFKAEGTIFSEHISSLGADHPSLSMASARGQTTDHSQGSLVQTGGTFDLAIEGDGYFLVETPNGERLTRAGSFLPNGDSELVTADGLRVLDAGGAPVFVPAGSDQIAISADGTLSAGGRALGQIGVVVPNDPTMLRREAGQLFRAEGGYGASDQVKVIQGFVEQSNVSPITEISRMIEVQRAYELGQSFIDKEDERIRGLIRSMGRS